MVGAFNDTYVNLAYKMAVTISWVADHCSSVDAMVKVDMDTYVNVGLLLNLTDKLPTQEYPNFVFGTIHNDAHPKVLRTGHWGVPKSVYPFDFYPKYIYGHSYVVSGPAVKLLAENFQYFPVIPNEDAFLTGIMAVTLNITRFYHSSFANLLTVDVVDKIERNILTTALVDSEKRRTIWNFMKPSIGFDDSFEDV